MTEERGSRETQPRVATHQGVGGHAEERRRRFQKHLLLFLGVNLGVIGADHLAVAPPGVQWAQWVLIPWLFIFVLHVIGLKSRGFSWSELVIPPKEPEIKEVFASPLEYEVIRARQLRDGVSNAAASVRDGHPELADSALAAADTLLEAFEGLYGNTSSGGEASDPTGELATALQAALDALDTLHSGLVRVEVLDAAPGDVEVDVLRERAETLRTLSR